MLLAAFASQRRGSLDQQAEDDRPIIAGQLDQIGLGNEAAEFDQLARSFTALHLPRTRVMPRPFRLQAVPRLNRSPMRRPRSRECLG